MTAYELQDRVVLAFERTLDHFMYYMPEYLLFPNLGIVAACQNGRNYD